MKQIARLVPCMLAVLAFGTALRGEDRAVFSFVGTNYTETIRGAMVLNRDVARSTTATGYFFENPVDFLHYTLSDASGVIGSFTLTMDNPNALTISKETDGSTRFFLLVEPVPSDPPFPGPPAFIMEFSFPGEAPWGDTVPDRTVEGATDIRLAASDLYPDAVAIVEITAGELSRQLGPINSQLRKIRRDLATGSKN